MANSIKSTGATLNRSGDGSAIYTNSWTRILAVKFPTVTSVTPFAASIQGYMQSDGSDNTVSDWSEFFQNIVADGDNIGLFFRPSDAGRTDIVLGSNASLVGVWIHVAFVFTRTSSVGGDLSIYALTEGFNQSSPSYLFTPSQGFCVRVATTGISLLWNDNDNDLGINISLAHEIIVNNDLTEAEVLEQFAQREPTDTVRLSTYAYQPFNDTATVGTDAGNYGTDYTQDTSGGAFISDATQPSDWAVPAVQAFPQNPGIFLDFNW